MVGRDDGSDVGAADGVIFMSPAVFVFGRLPDFGLAVSVVNYVTMALVLRELVVPLLRGEAGVGGDVIADGSHGHKVGQENDYHQVNPIARESFHGSL